VPDSAPRPVLFIQVFHTGVFPDGRPNANPVLVNDLDVGYEAQDRKVPVYVPHGGSIIIPASSRSMLSFHQGVIFKFCQVGILRARMFVQPERFTTATRPPATEYPIGVLIWNTTDDGPNWSDGTQWVGVAAAMGAAGGDLYGTYPNPQVGGLEGIPIEAPPPTNGDTLIYDGALNEWVHAPIVFGGGPPVGPAGGDLFGVYPNPTVTGLQTDPLAAKIANGFIKRNATNTAWEEVAYGSAANTVCVGNDARLSNARTPLVHAPTHATGGTDPLAVASTTATNNTATTGATVNSGTAAVAITDPGHTHTINAATATNTAITRVFHETLQSVQNDAALLVTLNNQAASALPSTQIANPRILDVDFPAAWNGGTVTVNGTDLYGTVVTETFTKPGGGGVAHGTKVFSFITNAVNNTPAVTLNNNAQVNISFEIGVANVPVTAFLKVTIQGVADTFAAQNLTLGWFDTTGNHSGGKTVEVWYTQALTVTQNSHTHTAVTASTGVTTSDAGHTHGVTDPGHGHTQNGHVHNLTG